MPDHIKPTLDDYRASFQQQGKFSLFYQTINADLFTAVSLMLKIQAKHDYCFLFESVEGGEKLGRYSFIGFDSALTWSVQDDIAHIDNIPQKEPPLTSFETVIQQCRIADDCDQLPPGIAGLYGYFGFEMMQHFEDIQFRDKSGLDTQQAIFFLPEKMIVIDHVKNIAFLIIHHKNDLKKTAKENRHNALDKFRQIEAMLKEPINVQMTMPIGQEQQKTPLSFQSNMAKEDFIQKVESAKEYIKQGDAFQIVLSQRFEMDYPNCPFAFYRQLRQLNPSPFLFFLKFDDLSVAGSSPEILVRVRKNIVTLRPIAGTRHRGRNKDEDQKLESDLLADPKELSEHLMLLDLGRNDVGRIAEIGSVTVTDQFFVEYYSHVMHIVSNVEGTLKHGKTALDALRCGFPAGTVSGAPKIRAVEIIDELEQTKRGIYAGCIGYIDALNQMDTCIALRTAVIKDNKIYVQAGAGIVHDSVAELEYQETVNKAKALLIAASHQP